MQELVWTFLGYYIGDIIILILGRFGLAPLAPVITPVVKGAIKMFLDPKGEVQVEEKKMFRTVIRPATEEEKVQMNQQLSRAMGAIHGPI